MKRLWIGILLLLLGMAAISGLGMRTAALRQENAGNLRLLHAETQAVTEARARRSTLEDRVRLQRDQWESWQRQEQSGGKAAALKPIFENSNLHLFMDPKTSETLLADLGFNWNSTGDYLVISKATLFGVGTDGLRGGKLSDAAAKMLAIQPAEQAAIETLAGQAAEQLRQWTTTHVRRDEPTDKDYLLQLTVEADPEGSSALRRSFTNGVVSVLGPVRGQAMIRYAGQWMHEMNMGSFNTDPVVIQVHRIGRTSRGLETELVLRHGGSVNSVPIQPGQPVPPYVSFLYPGGWEELAAREGFELSEKFRE